MTRLFKTICSAAVMLAVSSNIFAQETRTTTSNGIKNDSCNPCKPKCEPACKPCPPCCFFEQGLDLPDDCRPPCDVRFFPAYNAAAQPRVDCSWDFNVDATFIYWYVNQDDMNIAEITPSFSGTNGEIVDQSTGYAPGFKIGLGWDTLFDNWALNAEYTWLHTSKSGSVANGTPGNGLYTLTNWFPNLGVVNNKEGITIGYANYTNVDSTWKMHLDQLDLIVSRPFYEGTHLTVSPSAGIRGLWIRQSLKINVGGGNLTDLGVTGESVTTSQSWAVGPKVGVNTHWLLGMGFRFDYLMGSSLLYSHYDLKNIKLFPKYSFAPKSENTKNVVRPTLDMGFGFGYGMYALRNTMYFDLAVRYDFSQFWSQNMMRNFVSQLEGGAEDIGDLFMHGLTITLRTDF